MKRLLLSVLVCTSMTATVYSAAAQEFRFKCEPRIETPPPIIESVVRPQYNPGPIENPYIEDPTYFDPDVELPTEEEYAAVRDYCNYNMPNHVECMHPTNE